MPQRHGRIAERAGRGDRGADVEAAAEALDVVDRGEERARGGRAYDDREDDQREHGQRHAGAEAHAQGVRHGHLQHGGERADPAEHAHREAEQRIGVVDDQPGRAGDHHEPADHPRREVHAQLAPDDGVHRLERQQPPREQEPAGQRVGQPLADAHGAHERHEADHGERQPERERRRLPGLQPAHGHRDARDEPRRSQHEPAAAAAPGRRLGQPPDRGHDVEDAHPPRGDGDDREGRAGRRSHRRRRGSAAWRRAGSPALAS